jgi:glycosyltransferase involved in cell wall biosynthesis
MLEDKLIGVVVPAHNEEKLIGRVIETMPDFVDRIYVVDDCSSDGTRDRVGSYLSQEPLDGRLELLCHAANHGVGKAIITGYRRAAEEGMDAVAVMAGDAQMDPAELERLVRPILCDEADYVKGNRLFTGEAWDLIPRYRYLGNAFLSLLTKIASGYWHVADSQTGYTAISAETIRLLPLEKLYSRYGYPNHLLVMLNVFGQRVRDVPVRPVYNIGERSGIRLWKVIPSLSWLLVKCFLWRLKEKYIIRDFHPLVFFYVLAFFLLFISVPLFARMILRWVSTGRIPPINALAFMFTVITGMQSTFFAMWFDMEYNKSLKVQ